MNYWKNLGKNGVETISDEQSFVLAKLNLSAGWKKCTCTSANSWRLRGQRWRRNSTSRYYNCRCFVVEHAAIALKSNRYPNPDRLSSWAHRLCCWPLSVRTDGSGRPLRHATSKVYSHNTLHTGSPRSDALRWAVSLHIYTQSIASCRSNCFALFTFTVLQFVELLKLATFRNSSNSQKYAHFMKKFPKLATKSQKNFLTLSSWTS